ncbi:MAG: hypothetical protein AAFQ82_05235, partial [Myxococcota bacterium]
MPELTHRNLFRAQVPDSWTDLLRVLAEIESVTHDETTPSGARRTQLVALRAALLNEVDALRGTLPLEHARPELLLQHFCEAVLLWTLYPRSGARLVYSTFESMTLPHFELDLPDDAEAIQAVRKALSTAFEVPASKLEAWLHELELQASNLRLKRAIVEVLVTRLKATGDGRDHAI